MPNRLTDEELAYFAAYASEDAPRADNRCSIIASEMLAALVAEIRELRALVNSPQTENFIEAVRTEAAHQVERWGADHDAGKTDADWFWLIGYLAGKAIRGDAKKLHHIITTAAACLNWHRHATGESTRMRPGIEPPKEQPDE